MNHKIESMAAALYDGGWRAADREQLIEEHSLDKETVDAVCECLERWGARGTKITPS